ncbi:MAG: type II toxin-antitoxin system VapC family toxin [Dermatophilaceae bacterium]
MTRPRLVVDSSVVIAALITTGEVADRLTARMADRELHAPDHLPVEVLHVLNRRRIHGLLPAPAARHALGDLWSIPLTRWPLEPLAARAWELGHTVSAYDAAYVALAEHLECPLLTGDARLARAHGPRCKIVVER